MSNHISVDEANALRNRNGRERVIMAERIAQLETILRHGRQRLSVLEAREAMLRELVKTSQALDAKSGLTEEEQRIWDLTAEPEEVVPSVQPADPINNVPACGDWVDGFERRCHKPEGHDGLHG